MEQINLKERLNRAHLYCITQRPASGQTVEKMVEQACMGGADVIQFREKNISVRELTALSKKLIEISRRFGALFIVNDRLDAALASGADGVHLGQDDLPIDAARRIADAYLSSAQSNFLIGCSTHSLDQAEEAQNLGADYVGCGPIFSTPTKPDYAAVGLDLVGEYRKNIKIPFVAIGGIDRSNIDQAIGAGAGCIAVVRAVFGSNDIESSARFLKSQFSK